MLPNSFQFRRVVKEDVCDIQNLFFKTFGKHITFDYYLFKFFDFDKFNSFICLIDGEVVGHVGFNIRNVTLTNNTSVLIANRFTSMVSKDFRGVGIYNKLLTYSFGELKTQDVDILQVWPNLNNLKATCLNPDLKNLICIPTFEYYCNGDLAFNESLFTIFTERHVKKIHNFIHNSFLGNDFSYLISRYCNHPDKSYFIYSLNSSFLIFGVNSVNSTTFINVVDIFSDTEVLNEFLSCFVSELLAFNLVIQIWCSLENRNLLNSVVSSGFKPTGHVFFTGVYFFKRDVVLLPLISDYFSTISMGDCDVF